AALMSLAALPEERPASLVVLTDGRLDRPSENSPGEAAVLALRGLKIPVHTVSLAQSAPPDASIRAVRAAGAAVAHQPLPLTIQIGCDGGLACEDLTVSARELVEGGPPALLASGVAHVDHGTATVELTITLDRAGPRIVEVAIQAPDHDAIPDNDRRFVAFDVARDRVRVLHVAGRPTYDVRALRMWLKADASVDVVAFFILRTHSDDVNAGEEDLALIPFPVHELFSEHLPSFDAVVLQDFNAAPYELLQHLPALARYVEHGGGLIMVGGPDSFAGGHYAGTRLADVLPVALEQEPGEPAFDLAPFVPVYTEVAREAPVLRPLWSFNGDALPEMAGANRVGDARPGSFVLFTHPRLKTRSGAPMPLLSLGEKGDGRAIALAIDGTYRLAYSALGSETAGRAHSALWDGLLGWLMRDPRYEPAQIELPSACMAGLPLSLRVRPLPGSEGPLNVEISRLEKRGVAVRKQTVNVKNGESTTIDVGKLEPGGYSARVWVGTGPSTRRDFACERGGEEWADSRPDEARLRAIAKATGGEFMRAADVGRLPLPPSTEVAAERRVEPVLPPWTWTLMAAAALGAHWIARRKTGLA
ncbi:MAG TPA: glutamine amidotransferase, partial [Polyangiaceae bacterium]|nr:glutamine amidotransferase [Polyangiaceae bacterium]